MGERRLFFHVKHDFIKALEMLAMIHYQISPCDQFRSGYLVCEVNLVLLPLQQKTLLLIRC